MATLAAGSNTTIAISVGSVLRASGSGTAQILPPGAPGDDTQQRTLSAAETNFGPYTVAVSVLLVANSSGAGITYNSDANAAGQSSVSGDRDPNGFAMIGDSRQKSVHNDSEATPAVITKLMAWHFWTWANWTPAIAGAMKLYYAGGQGGYTTDQYLARLDGAIASRAGWLIIWGTANDVLLGYTAEQSWFGWASGAKPATGNVATSVGVKGAVDAALAAGMRVVLVGETGYAATSGNFNAMRAVNKYDGYCKKYARQYPGRVVFWDPKKASHDRTAAYTKFKTGYSTDGTHPIALGCAYQGWDFAAVIQPYLALSCGDVLPIGLWEQYGNGGIQLLSNQLFTTTTGGQVGTGVTGNVPSNWRVDCIGSCTVAVSTGASTAADPVGNELILTVTPTGAGSVKITHTGVPAPAAGDVWLGGFEVAVDGTPANYCGAYMQAFSQTDPGSGAVNNSVYSHYTASALAGMGPGPAVAYTQIQRTPEMTVNSGTATQQNVQIYAVFEGAASAITVRIRRPSLMAVPA